MRGRTISAKSHRAVSHKHNDCCLPQSLNKCCWCIQLAQETQLNIWIVMSKWYSSSSVTSPSVCRAATHLNVGPVGEIRGRVGSDCPCVLKWAVFKAEFGQLYGSASRKNVALNTNCVCQFRLVCLAAHRAEDGIMSIQIFPTEWLTDIWAVKLMPTGPLALHRVLV